MAQPNTLPGTKTIDNNYDSLSSLPGVFSLSETPGIDHRFDEATGQEFIKIDKSVPYPRDLSNDDPLTEVVLLQVPTSQDTFKLPKDYITVQHALNEASGVGVVTEGMSTPQQDAGREMFQQIFTRIGEMVGSIAVSKQALPAALHYRKLIIERTSEGSIIRILPPVELVEAPTKTDQENGIKKLKSDLSSELFEGATDQAQRQLTHIGLRAFTKTVKTVMNNGSK